MNEEPAKPINRNIRRDAQRLSSVTTAIHLMKTFSLDERELGISELAKRLKIAKSTVHRLATALLDEGLLEQNPETGRYRLGIGLFSLGSQVRTRLDVAAEAKPFLNDLRQRTGENARLAILDKRNVVFIHDFESNESIRLRSITGQFRPAHTTAEGLCLLAGLRAPALEEFLGQPLLARTANTLTNPDELAERIRRVKRAGYATEDEECEEGTRCIAAPVHQADGRVIAALGMAGPRLRIKKRDFPSLADLVIGMAQKLSERLGYEPGQPIYVRSP
ncbi:IclR family transcriptional regulator [Fertoebacter nigrum]|uniref:IclR family transcriptional regulator n=1 Tax=Fertoeibacter niger TaxID=2656921 RepID=A0A8X8KS05_9RHOB|nr:IclR family transcriptional regulator [Fertoeibacter niger]NUB45862.1 IclR family transcriptional regulator [Fertoeibacter niger]